MAYHARDRHGTEITKGAGLVPIGPLVSLCICACPGFPGGRKAVSCLALLPALGRAHQALSECFPKRMVETTILAQDEVTSLTFYYPPKVTACRWL